mmetsp:Transcript_88530/g.274080  ORF Transcript_88530/g.274080 Transcript_88530/m.274080 type:complete len:230 (+) Transcript_88530:3-692(+)
MGEPALRSLLTAAATASGTLLALDVLQDLEHGVRHVPIVLGVAARPPQPAEHGLEGLQVLVAIGHPVLLRAVRRGQVCGGCSEHALVSAGLRGQPCAAVLGLEAVLQSVLNGAVGLCGARICLLHRQEGALYDVAPAEGRWAGLPRRCPMARRWLRSAVTSCRRLPPPAATAAGGQRAPRLHHHPPSHGGRQAGGGGGPCRHAQRTRQHRAAGGRRRRGLPRSWVLLWP